MTNQFMPPNKAIAAIANSGKEEAIDHSNPRHHPRPPTSNLRLRFSELSSCGV